MGKTTRWLKGLLAKIRSDSPPSDSPKLKKRWTLLRSSNHNPNPKTPSSAPPHTDATTKHAIAVAAASAAAAEAAVAAAQAAADVVRLTSAAYGSRCGAWAALVIQSHFRGYLARRALRALKGLVKLQALVRGHITRKKAAETMRSIQAMLRAQERARCLRAYESPNSSEKSSQTYHRGPPTPEKFEQISYGNSTKKTQSAVPKNMQGSLSRSIKRVMIHPNPSWTESVFEDSMWSAKGRGPQHGAYNASSSGEDEYHIRSDKLLQTSKQGPKRRKNLLESIGVDLRENSRSTTVEEDEEMSYCTAENSPQCYSGSSRGGHSSRRQSPLTPTKSDASATSCVSNYSDCPSYMSYTESSRAKMRSLSAPRQRPAHQFQEKAGSTNRPSVYQQRDAAQASASSAAMQACFASKAYAGSGRMDRLGLPARKNTPPTGVLLQVLGSINRGD